MGKNVGKYVKRLSFKDKLNLTDDLVEIHLHNLKIVEKYPLQCGLTVLQLSKLNLMNFVLFLNDFLVKDSFELIYSGTFVYIFRLITFGLKCMQVSCVIPILDTDSICLTSTGELDDIVKPEKIKDWEKEKQTWFVAPPSGNLIEDSRDARWPGKMKEEWSSNSGAIIWYVY